MFNLYDLFKRFLFVFLSFLFSFIILTLFNYNIYPVFLCSVFKPFLSYLVIHSPLELFLHLFTFSFYLSLGVTVPFITINFFDLVLPSCFKTEKYSFLVTLRWFLIYLLLCYVFSLLVFYPFFSFFSSNDEHIFSSSFILFKDFNLQKSYRLAVTFLQLLHAFIIPFYFFFLLKGPFFFYNKSISVHLSFIAGLAGFLGYGEFFITFFSIIIFFNICSLLYLFYVYYMKKLKRNWFF